ncbi:MAG TPA: hypothetical protein VIQ74_12515, partial [Gemmatimonadaceae bacterium]
MTDRRRPTRRGRGPRPQNHVPADSSTDSSPYREDTIPPNGGGEVVNGDVETPTPGGDSGNAGAQPQGAGSQRRGRDGKDPRETRDGRFGANGRRGRRGRGRSGPRP